jgi:hypothetical protein
MATRSPEGGNLYNIDPKTVRVAPEQRRFESGTKKPEVPTKQPANPSHKLSEHYRREQERHSGVFENPIQVPRKPGEHVGEAVVFRRGRSQPEQQDHSSRKPEPLPRSKKDRISELIDLYHEEIHLPSITKELTPKEQTQLQEWVNSLTHKELGQEIRKRREQLDKDFRDQWPPPNSLLRV